MFQSKMIVEAHGGRLTVASTPGRGATFQVLLPLHGK
jgi:signal transduction histidine kinase